ncbi:hypothetical protein J5N97_013163 [Dioscorea zingiberensis]|uniref:Uncharacterized protein n=1 Tax=Dioscorea zingiberensis TaxID=325984 RepID=A0A9D5HII1_9LILI|nr:hypothetical protein J5N97_013163 [Dioscorea zingiberensis]
MGEGIQAKTNFIYTDTSISTFHPLLTPFQIQTLIPLQTTPPQPPPQQPYHFTSTTMTTNPFILQSTEITSPDVTENVADDFLFSHDTNSGYLSSIIPESYLRSTQNKEYSPHSHDVHSAHIPSTPSTFADAYGGGLLGATTPTPTPTTTTTTTSSQSFPCFDEIGGSFWVDEPLWQLNECDFPVTTTDSSMGDNSNILWDVATSSSVSSMADAFDMGYHL